MLFLGAINFFKKFYLYITSSASKILHVFSSAFFDIDEDIPPAFSFFSHRHRPGIVQKNIAADIDSPLPY